jgi:hypothetical protein
MTQDGQEACEALGTAESTPKPLRASLMPFGAVFRADHVDIGVYGCRSRTIGDGHARAAASAVPYRTSARAIAGDGYRLRKGNPA